MFVDTILGNTDNREEARFFSLDEYSTSAAWMLMCDRPDHGGWCFLLSVAGGDLDVPHALLALDIAAPVELALASLRPTFSPRCVATVATQ